MIKLELKDGSILEVESGISALDACKKISEGLARKMACAKLDGEVMDMRMPITKDGKFEVCTLDDQEGMKTFWHTSSHVMAQAVKKLFPDVKLAIGPSIDNGFYYDFDTDHPFSDEDCAKIEEELSQLEPEDKEMFLEDLGIDSAGLDKMIPIDFGTLYVIVNAVLLLFALFADRHYIGIATFINLFLLGYITDFTHKTLLLNIVDTSSLDSALASEFLAAPTSVNPAGLNIPMWLRIAFIVGAIIVICFGSALYMTADLGVSTYDAVALVITNTWKIGKFQYIRIITDVICVVLGAVIFRLGGGTWGEIPTIIGIGTIITAFFMGPLIEFFNENKEFDLSENEDEI